MFWGLILILNFLTLILPSPTRAAWAGQEPPADARLSSLGSRSLWKLWSPSLGVHIEGALF